MHVTDKLIEFDAREMREDFTKTWPLSRREQYLLRQDIVKPLSTDTMVWSSLRGECTARCKENLAEVLGLTDPDEVAQKREYWDWYIQQDLDVLQRCMRWYREHGLHWIIATSVLTSNPLTGEAVSFTDPMTYLAAATPEPSQRDPSWSLIGFDVSDGCLLSGLTNCGYEPQELRDAQERWATHLNQYHLFNDPASAWQFKEYSDQRVSEHRPFYVCGLWLVEQLTGQTRRADTYRSN